MIRKDRGHLLAYLMVSALSVSGAFLISLHFVKRARAQDPGPATSGTAVPASPAGGPASGGPAREKDLSPPRPAAAAVPPRPATDSPTGVLPPSPAPSPAHAPTPGPAPKPALNTAAIPSDTTVANGGAPMAGINELEGFLEPFIYDIVNRRDPFQAFAEYVPTATAEDNSAAKPLSAAQRWDLDQLKLIGIMWDIKDPKAMFLDPEEDVMILGRDESIGNRNGYVATIREGEVVVVEAIRKRGDIIYRTRVLRIER